MRDVRKNYRARLSRLLVLKVAAAPLGYGARHSFFSRTANLRNPKPKSNRLCLSLGANLLSSGARDPTGRGEFSERGLRRAPCHGSSEAHSPRQWAGRLCRVASFGDRDKAGGSPVELMRGARRNYRAHPTGRREACGGEGNRTIVGFRIMIFAVIISTPPPRPPSRFEPADCSRRSGSGSPGKPRCFYSGSHSNRPPAAPNPAAAGRC